ncbi:hypothetical protein V2J09_001865 [Rumex salicifolius]
MQPDQPSQLPADSTELIDAPLNLFGFQFDELTPTKVSGRLPITENCCQPFKVLHGGVSALIAEALGSIGARLACGLKRVAGVQLSINHVKSATIGDLVVAEATPVNVGRTIQVWEVRLWKMDSSKATIDANNKIMISSSRVTVFCNMPMPDDSEDSKVGLRKNARL